MSKYFRLFFTGVIALFLVGCGGDTDLETAEKYYSSGNYKVAIEKYTEYLRLNPESITSFYNRGRAWEELGEHEKAIKDFQKVIEIEPGHTNAHLSLGIDNYLRLKNYGKAIVHMNEALATNPDNAEALTIRGRAYQHLGKLDKSENDYNNAINIDRNYAEAYFSRGMLKYHLKKKTAACNDFRMAGNLGSENGKNALADFCN